MLLLFMGLAGVVGGELAGKSSRLGCLHTLMPWADAMLDQKKVAFLIYTGTGDELTILVGGLVPLQVWSTVCSTLAVCIQFSGPPLASHVNNCCDSQLVSSRSRNTFL